MSSATFTVRVDSDIKKRLEKLAKSTGRSRSRTARCSASSPMFIPVDAVLAGMALSASVSVCRMIAEDLRTAYNIKRHAQNEGHVRYRP